MTGQHELAARDCMIISTSFFCEELLKRDYTKVHIPIYLPCLSGRNREPQGGGWKALGCQRAQYLDSMGVEFNEG